MVSFDDGLRAGVCMIAHVNYVMLQNHVSIYQNHFLILIKNEQVL